MRELCISGNTADWEGGALPGRFKLLSVNVTPRYLDSNYTCQLSLSSHLSLFLSLCLSVSSNPHMLYSSYVFNKTMHSFFSFLYSSVTSLRVSQYYLSRDSPSHSPSVPAAALILSVASDGENVACFKMSEVVKESSELALVLRGGCHVEISCPCASGHLP